MSVDVSAFDAPLRIGTRGSELALWQTEHVKRLLERAWGGRLRVEVEIIKTQGDAIQDRPLYEVGGKGLFVTAIEDQLLDGRVDVAVHSMKDLPATLPERLIVACMPPREDARDALVAAPGTTLAKLPAGAKLGTTSLRRAALARRINPGVQIVPIRGNVPTRLAFVTRGELDAVLLAQAGLNRLGLAHHVAETLDPERFCPAVAQGVLAIECREADARARALLEPLHHPDTAVCATAERAFLAHLEGGCTVPLGAHALLHAADVLAVSGVVVAPSGRPCFMAHKVGHPRDAAALGRELAQTLLRLGAGQVIAGAGPLQAVGAA
jgi:hydroxymethylbilane synthase